MRAVLARCSRRCLTKAYAKPTILRPSNARTASVATLPSGLAIPTTADIDAFRAIVGEANVLVNADAVVKYNRDWLKQYHGSTPAVIRPKTTAEVSAIMKHCNSRRIAVVPQGGNTGLVGGSVPIGHEIVLSLERMNSVVAFDEASGVLVCEAGCVLQVLDEKLANHGYMMPLDLGAKGSCMIGGNVSTNAGGLRLLRYGSLHGSVLGVEVVQADGAVLDLMSVLRKDNVGFDLKQLFIGAEGSLGIVTAVSIQTAPRPASVKVAMFGCQSFEACRTLLLSAKRGLGEILSAVEFVDRDAMDLTLGTLFPEAGPAPFGTSTMPMSEPHNFYVVIETAGSNAAHDNEKLEGFLSTVTDAGTVQDGVVAADVKQARHLWRLREDVSVAISQRGHVYKYDLSFPLPHMYDIVEVMREKLAPWRASHGVVPVGYGHLGDSNLHLNISTPSRNQPYHDQLLQEIEPFVFEFTLQHKGSVSAEHGLGQAKASWLDRAKPAPATALMRQLKSILDPHGILNPCKVIPQLR